MIRHYFNFHHLVDTHAHINIEELNQIAQIISDAKSAGVEVIFDIATDLTSSKASLENSERFAEIKSFVGIDPQVYLPNEKGVLSIDEKNVFEEFRGIENLIKEKKGLICGIGETGIDNYWLNRHSLSSTEKEESLEKQESLFRKHLELAEVNNLPLSIHSRNAEDICLKIIKRYNCFGVFHSFTGTYETAKEILDNGWGLGMNGIITYKNANELRDVYHKILGKIPPDATPSWFYDRGVYFETDSPFLSPEQERGERNKPSRIKTIFEFISK